MGEAAGANRDMSTWAAVVVGLRSAYGVFAGTTSCWPAFIVTSEPGAAGVAGAGVPADGGRPTRAVPPTFTAIVPSSTAKMMGAVSVREGTLALPVNVMRASSIESGLGGRALRVARMNDVVPRLVAAGAVPCWAVAGPDTKLGTDTSTRTSSKETRAARRMGRILLVVPDHAMSGRAAGTTIVAPRMPRFVTPSIASKNRATTCRANSGLRAAGGAHPVPGRGSRLNCRSAGAIVSAVPRQGEEDVDGQG